MTVTFAVRDYDLAATLASGQTFRWRLVNDAWEGVVGPHWIRLRQRPDGIEAEIASGHRAAGGEPLPTEVRAMVASYLRVDEDLASILATFPKDAPMAAAVAACRGLRLLRQEPWECLASFICSSTKQIVQIEQIVALLCTRFGPCIAAPPGVPAASGFPAVGVIAKLNEPDLRACKLGFRAPYLLGTARAIANGDLSLESLSRLDTESARAALMQLPGVGRKIADCVLLFAYGRQDAFPVDVWVARALHQLYFPRVRQLSPQRLRDFSQTHFGPFGGYAQQYLFHYFRTHIGRR